MAGLNPKFLRCGILLGEAEQCGSLSFAAMRELFATLMVLSDA
jgi:hypothetical protein